MSRESGAPRHKTRAQGIKGVAQIEVAPTALFEEIFAHIAQQTKRTAFSTRDGCSRLVRACRGGTGAFPPRWRLGALAALKADLSSRRNSTKIDRHFLRLVNFYLYHSMSGRPVAFCRCQSRLVATFRDRSRLFEIRPVGLPLDAAPAVPILFFMSVETLGEALSLGWRRARLLIQSR